MTTLPLIIVQCLSPKLFRGGAIYADQRAINLSTVFEEFILRYFDTIEENSKTI